MDVEQRLNLAADFLRRETAGWDADGFTARLTAAAGIPMSPIGGPGTPAGDPRGAPGGYRCTNGSGGREFRAELDQLLHHGEEAEEGGGVDAATLRRIAELIELLDGRAAALSWWHRAAQAGDELAAAALD